MIGVCRVKTANCKTIKHHYKCYPDFMTPLNNAIIF